MRAMPSLTEMTETERRSIEGLPDEKVIELAQQRGFTDEKMLALRELQRRVKLSGEKKTAFGRGFVLGAIAATIVLFFMKWWTSA